MAKWNFPGEEDHGAFWRPEVDELVQDLPSRGEEEQMDERTDEGVAEYFVAGMLKAREEGLDLFARTPTRGQVCRVSARPVRPSSKGAPSQESDARPPWNRSTVPKPWSSEGFKVNHTRWSAWALQEDRRSLEAQARDRRVQVMCNELSRYLHERPTSGSDGGALSRRSP
ncbi:unnamed protein product [Durusdinium trenchii]|uniref:Cilia- and flagella-associated protein 206 n=2 Tax=Durusdinium trenchii TaxID=1381693 RepID=A0ABP0PM76_9DINO